MTCFLFFSGKILALSGVEGFYTDYLTTQNAVPVVGSKLLPSDTNKLTTLKTIDNTVFTTIVVSVVTVVGIKSIIQYILRCSPIMDMDCCQFFLKPS